MEQIGKKTFRLALMALLLLLSGCYESEEVDEGFPNSVEFPKEGGVKTISGFRGFISVEIEGGTDSFYNEGENNVMTVESDWLKIEYTVHSKDITLYARPVMPSEPRLLKVRGYVDKDYVIIKVKI